MSNTPVLDAPVQGLSTGSGQTLPSRPPQTISDPSASKRVCFYKSGDYKFTGHRMVINARTFKTFDGLLDALSKKVPLPFGVRTITTPRGTHLVKALDDLHDGGNYVCSDQKKVKPLNMEEVNRRQVPWNTTRPFSAGRRRHQGVRFGHFSRRNEVANRPARVTERVAVRTPRRLVVIKNREPTVKRTIVLQRRTAPTFDALLDYLSQIMAFPVLKLYSTDGRRVDGLATLILCSGVVVAAGNEPFRLGSHSFHGTGQMAQAMFVDTVEPSVLQLGAPKNKSLSSGRGSRNFSLSSERYIVNQINKSQNESTNSYLNHHNASFDHHHTSAETCGNGRVDNGHHSCVVPQDDDIEKSFRVNQDGTMTVEMKVRLTIKEEEMLHWTTTLSRSSLNLTKRTVHASISGSANSSPDSNNAVAKDSSHMSEDETKEKNYPAGDEKAVGFDDERIHEGYTSTTSGKTKSLKRTPTPGPRHVNKKVSVESVTMVTELGVQESTLGHYSYMERAAHGETTEGYCVVKHSSSSSSNKPIPKPRKTVSAGASKKRINSSMRSSGVAEVLQIQNNGMEITETVMHIYESQSCYDNYVANTDCSADSGPLHSSTPLPESQPSIESGPLSSSNDCDIDCSWQPPTADLLQRQKEEMLSLSSEPLSPAYDITNNLPARTENRIETATNPEIQKELEKNNTAKSVMKKKVFRPARSQRSLPSINGLDKKTKELISPSKNSKSSSADKLSSDASLGKNSLNSLERAKNGQKNQRVEKKVEMPQFKRSVKDEKMPRKDSALLVSTEQLKKTQPVRQSMNDSAAKYNDHNENTSTGRPQMKKNMSDILHNKKSLLPGKRRNSKPKAMMENRLMPPKNTSELRESVSMPSLNPSPSEIHQYVENWLEKVSPDPVPYVVEGDTDGAEPRSKVVFLIGGDSESDEKTESNTNLDEYYASTSDAVNKYTSCLSVPLFPEGPALLNTEMKIRGLCVSMPNVRRDAEQQENMLRQHKSAEVIGSVDDGEASSSILNPKAKIKPVLRKICSSIQNIRRASDINTTSNLEKSTSLPDFQTQVASVFGSSCKAFLSFLSVMTLRDSLKDEVGEASQSRTTSEAMLMIESLQKISVIDDEEEQKASLSDLQDKATSQFRARWKDFQILRERLESEPLSPKFSETEFALDVVSEGGTDVFEEQQLGINDLMEELNMPQDLRAEITSTFQQVKSFYPLEESTIVETEKNQSDSEEDVEQFLNQCRDETEQSAELDEIQSLYTQQAKTMTKSDQENVDTKQIDPGSVEEYIEKEEEGAVDEEEWRARLGEKEVAEESEEGLLDEEAREYDSVEETDEREGAEETEYEEDIKDEVEQEADEEEHSEEGETEETQVEDISKEKRGEEEVDENTEETDEKEEVETIHEEVEEEDKDEESDSFNADVEDEAEEDTDVQKEEKDIREVIEESYEEEEVENISEEEEEETGAVTEETEKEEEKDVEGNENEKEKEQIMEEEEEDEESDSFNADVEDEAEEDTDVQKDEKDMWEVIEESYEEEEVVNISEEEEEETGAVTEETEKEEEKDVEGNENEKEKEQIMEEEEEDEESDSFNADVEDEAEEDTDVQKEEKDMWEVIEESYEEEEVVNISEEEEEEETGAVTEETEKEEEKDVEGNENEKEKEQIMEEEEEDEESDSFNADVEEEAEEDTDVQKEEKDMWEVIEESYEEEEVENISEEEEETGAITEETEKEEEKDVEGNENEKEIEHIMEEEEEDEESDRFNADVEEEAEEDTDVQKEENDIREVIEESYEEEEVENISEEEEETDAVTEETEKEEEKDVGNENEKEKRQIMKEEEEDEESDRFNADVEEETEEDTDMQKEEKDMWEVIEESYEEEEVENISEEEEETGAITEETEKEEEKDVEGNEKEKEQITEEEEEDGEDVDEEESDKYIEEEEQSDTDCKNVLEMVSSEEQKTESPTKSSPENQCEDDNGKDTVNELESDEGAERCEKNSNSLFHPVEISQELLDFVNNALQSSSLTFTFDTRGNIRLEPENTRVLQSTAIPKRQDSSYGFKCLPSPSTSELSDYRPETSESGGYKTQDSLDILSESGEEASWKPSPAYTRSARRTERTHVKQVNSKLFICSNSENLQGTKLKSAGSFSSNDSGSKASKEDLSYFSAASSLKAEAEATTHPVQRISFSSEKGLSDGVLIEKGRWLLKENHLIRKSPPVSLGMYSNLDSTSVDTDQENTSEDSPHYLTNPLAAISSSELEELAKPPTPKCNYFNMPHGSDSDPFLDNASVKSVRKDLCRGGIRVSPIDTSRTWSKKNGSTSSFASVEFKIPDRKVHPEGESSAMAQARRTSTGGGSALQAQDSLDTLQVRCGQYCPIL
ncbi:oxygen-regulated protein 1 [Embiotoca jacksoni]|uniref:oxygen-regulated protein 1 n=1 Tax=Embiotoca jacksoni TaxID=100190 RepID=UPI003704421A